jgi:hypothetical protein
MTDTNVNLTPADLSALNDARDIARAERKEICRRRYKRQYARRGGRQPERMIRVSDIVTVTIGPLSAVTYPLNSLGIV